VRKSFALNEPAADNLIAVNFREKELAWHEK
jgi:hypothetical protein